MARPIPPLAAVLSLVASRALAQCVSLLPGLPPQQMARINFVYPNNDNQALRLSGGLNFWPYTCGTAVPNLQRVTSAIPGEVNIEVVWQQHGEACNDNASACGCTIRSTNSYGELTTGRIEVYEYSENNTYCGSTVRTYAHEAGHILGFQNLGAACSTNIMYESIGGGTTLTTDQCQAIDEVWLVPNEDPCDGAYPGPGCPNGQDSSPILMDLDINGFHLAGLSDPVLFDIDGDGTLETISWTAGGTLDAFLFLDRNGNGMVDHGGELFGNYTPLWDGSTAPNGYIPLAEFDLALLGGNANGTIDAGDAIYTALRLWVDYNHNGLSEAGEVLSLSEAAVTQISLVYHVSNRRDQHGNRFRYVSRARLHVGGHDWRTWTSDVFFVQE